MLKKFEAFFVLKKKFEVFYSEFVILLAFA